MNAISERFHYLFRSTKGLILVAIAMISLVTAIWGTLSGPMVEWGVRDITLKLTGMKLPEFCFPWSFFVWAFVDVF